MTHHEKDKKIIFIISLVMIVLVAIVVTPAILIKSKADDETKPTASVLFNSQLVKDENITKLAEDQVFDYVNKDESGEKFTSDIVASIDDTSYILLNYTITNKSDSNITSRVDFSNMEISNCVISCKSGDQMYYHIIALDNYVYSIEPQQSFSISIKIQVEELSLSSVFSGKLSLVLSIG